MHVTRPLALKAFRAFLDCVQAQNKPTQHPSFHSRNCTENTTTRETASLLRAATHCDATFRSFDFARWIGSVDAHARGSLKPDCTCGKSHAPDSRISSDTERDIHFRGFVRAQEESCPCS